MNYNFIFLLPELLMPGRFVGRILATARSPSVLDEDLFFAFLLLSI